MSGVIKKLPPEIAMQIAAGEVVNRPSSVVKELLENAIDAGATTIKVILVDAGRTLIQVVDNGAGMSSEDASLAFERHATSKISNSNDLYSLSTFGFRGEALASIASIAQVELRTRRDVDELGTSVKIAGSRIESISPEAVSKGTNIVVKNLFYNVPARRKFLKSNSTELSNIIHEVQRVALVSPDVAISLSHQDNEILSLNASSLKTRIVNLFGNRINQHLLPVEIDTKVVNIKGFTGNFESVKRKGVEQFFFVNGRYMRHPYFHKAVLTAYEGLVPEGCQPPYFIYLTVPTDTIDVNIHPTKTEIKFTEEHVIWNIILSAIRESVGRYEHAPTIDFNSTDIPDIPALDTNRPIVQPKVSIDPNYNPFLSGSTGSVNIGGWETLYNEKTSSPSNSINILEDRGVFDSDNSLCSSRVFQIKGRYIVVENRDSVLLVNQHRAHIRILYDRYLRDRDEQNIPSQGLLFPQMIQLSTIDAQWYSEMRDDFLSMGFNISDMGHGAIALQGVPEGVINTDYEALIHEIIDSYKDENLPIQAGKYDKIAYIIAKKSAISSGQILNQEEQQELVERLFHTSIPELTPDGKPIYIKRTDDQLDRLFNP